MGGPWERYEPVLKDEVKRLAREQRDLPPMAVWREVFRRLRRLPADGPLEEYAAARRQAEQWGYQPPRAAQRQLQRWVRAARKAGTAPNGPPTVTGAVTSTAGVTVTATASVAPPATTLRWWPAVIEALARLDRGESLSQTAGGEELAGTDERLVWRVIRHRHRAGDVGYWPTRADALCLAYLAKAAPHLVARPAEAELAAELLQRLHAWWAAWGRLPEAEPATAPLPAEVRRWWTTLAALLGAVGAPDAGPAPTTDGEDGERETDAQEPGGGRAERTPIEAPAR